jgi:hypothetical protein
MPYATEHSLSIASCTQASAFASTLLASVNMESIHCDDATLIPSAIAYHSGNSFFICGVKPGTGSLS